MARGKWSLPEMAKVTDQRLVWLVIALCGGILLADFVPLQRVGLGEAVLLALFGLLLAGLTAWLVMGRSQGALRAGFALILAVLAGMFFARLEWARHASPQLASAEVVSFSGQIEEVRLTADGRSRLRVSQLTPPPAAGVTAMRVWANAALTQRLAASGGLVHGAAIEGRARLFPLSGPLLAGTADYGRQLWLSGIGATGYLMRAEASAAEHSNLATRLDRLRHAVARRLLERMGQPAGPIAAALLVGVRDQMDETVYDWFRASGLAHLLAISGLHMAFFCFGLYAILRAGGALLPRWTEGRALHKYLAIPAVAGGFVYLCLAGFPVSALRAWLMAVLIMLAVLLDRQALTLRNLALVAGLVLIARPSLLHSAGFQLSFAATAGIIGILPLLHDIRPDNRYLRWLLMMLASSLMASLMTMPFVAWHFADFTLWSLIANLLAIPLTGLVIMPLGIGGLLLMPLGLEGPVLDMMGLAINGLARFARLISQAPLAGIWIKPPPAFVLFLVLLAAGCGFACLGRARLLVLAPLLLAAGIWLRHPVPVGVLLSHQTQQILVVREDNGRFRQTGDLSDFWRGIIAERLGSAEWQACSPPFCRVQAASQTLHLVPHRSGLGAACRQRVPILSAERPGWPCRNDTPPIEARPLRRGETYLIYLDRNGQFIWQASPDSRLWLPWRAHLRRQEGD